MLRNSTAQDKFDAILDYMNINIGASDFVAILRANEDAIKEKLNEHPDTTAEEVIGRIMYCTSKIQLNHAFKSYGIPENAVNTVFGEIQFHYIITATRQEKELQTLTSDLEKDQDTLIKNFNTQADLSDIFSNYMKSISAENLQIYLTHIKTSRAIYRTKDNMTLEKVALDSFNKIKDTISKRPDFYTPKKINDTLEVIKNPVTTKNSMLDALNLLGIETTINDVNAIFGENQYKRILGTASAEEKKLYRAHPDMVVEFLGTFDTANAVDEALQDKPLNQRLSPKIEEPSQVEKISSTASTTTSKTTATSSTLLPKTPVIKVATVPKKTVDFSSSTSSSEDKSLSSSEESEIELDNLSNISFNFDDTKSIDSKDKVRLTETAESSSDDADSSSEEGISSTPTISSSPIPESTLKKEPREKMLADNFVALNNFMKKNKSLPKANKQLEYLAFTNNLSYLKDHLHANNPLVEKINAYNNSGSEDAYLALKKEALKMEEYTDQFRNKNNSKFFEFNRKTEIVDRHFGRIKDYVIDSMSSPSKMNKDEKNARIKECEELIDKINIIIGRMYQHTDAEKVYAKDIAKFQEHNARLNTAIEKMKAIGKVNIEETEYRSYSKKDTKFQEFKGKTAQEKLKEITERLTSTVKNPVASKRSDFAMATLVESFAFAKGTKLKDKNGFNYHEDAEIYYADEKAKVAEYKSKHPAANDNRDKIPFEVNQATAVVGDNLVSVVRYGEAPDYVSDENMMNMAAKFMLETYAAMRPEDYGKELALSDDVHERFAVAVCAFCDLSVERFPRPITSADTSKIDQKYLEKMDKHLQKDATKVKLKQNKYAELSINERQKTVELESHTSPKRTL